MADIFSKEERSHRMSLIRGKWTKQEKLVHNYLKGHKIKHKMHPEMNGSPDIVLEKKRMAIFLHGCFWHGCPLHATFPKTNYAFWKKKLKKNKARDQAVNRTLKSKSWHVLRIWQHELYNPKNIIKCICSCTTSR